eukprot:13101676-Alexandrium_andersonii.AAC.1
MAAESWSCPIHKSSERQGSGVGQVHVATKPQPSSPLPHEPLPSEGGESKLEGHLCCTWSLNIRRA